MKRKAPTVREFMTHIPVECEQCETVGDALALMRTQGIRHLPVMSGSRLKGLISHRDILEARIQRGTSVDDLPLDAVCRQDVFSVGPLEPLNEVAGQMLSRRLGSAVVVDGGYVVGIFTTTDALRALSDIFR